MPPVVSIVEPDYMYDCLHVLSCVYVCIMYVSVCVSVYLYFMYICGWVGSQGHGTNLSTTLPFCPPTTASYASGKMNLQLCRSAVRNCVCVRLWVLSMSMGPVYFCVCIPVCVYVCV